MAFEGFEGDKDLAFPLRWTVAEVCLLKTVPSVGAIATLSPDWPNCLKSLSFLTSFFSSLAGDEVVMVVIVVLSSLWSSHCTSTACHHRCQLSEALWQTPQIFAVN